MKTWYFRVGRKTSLDVVYEDTMEASSAEDVARKLEQGPVKFWYKGEVYTTYVGSKYLYEIREL